MAKNQLKTIQDRNNSNKILVSRLNTKNLVNEPIILNKQQQEIILVENSLFSGSTIKQYNYQFENFADNYLPYVQPIVIFSTEPAFDFETEYSSTNAVKWWEQLNTNYVFNISTQGYILVDIGEPTQFFAPVYVSIKLKIYNTQLFNSFKVI